MVGYVQMYKPEMKMREYEQYRGVYCSLCKCIGKRYGLPLRMALSYDLTFLALLSMAMHKECVGFTSSRCSYNPLKKCLQCQQTAALETAADITALMLYYRLEDHIRDEGFFGRLTARLYMPIAKHYRRKAQRYLPQADVWFAEMSAAQCAIEAADTCSLDAAAEPFAQLLERLLGNLTDDPKQQQVAQRLGYCLGRYVYLADAAADMEQDGKTGSFNPFVKSCSLNVGDRQALQNCRAYTAEVLRHCQAECIAAFNLLELHRFEGVLRNVLQEGISHTVDTLSQPKEEKRKKSV